jgi:hypothetical protein
MRRSNFESFVERILILFIGMLFAFTATVQVSKAQSEAEMRDRLCADMQREVVVQRDLRKKRGYVRVDCLNRDYAIEVDRSAKWAEALGQALLYSEVTNKKLGIILVCYGAERVCLKHALGLEALLSHLKRRATLWRCPQTAHNREADCVKREFGVLP